MKNLPADARNSLLLKHRPPLAQRPPMKIVPLTYIQEWALKHMAHEEDPYICYLFMRLRGVLNVDVLRKSLNSVIQRHDALRTRIVAIDGELKQEIDEPAEYQLDVMKLSGGLEIEIESKARDSIRKFCGRKTDLSVDPLVDYRLMELGDSDHVLAIVINHLLFDTFSAALLLRELWTLYGDFIQGRPSSLSKTPLQYSDYAVWQRDERICWTEKQQSYWKATLAGVAPAQLPIDSGLQNVTRFSCGNARISFDEPLSCALHELARCECTTPGMVVMALYAILLSSWSGQREFILPCVVPGRLHPKHLGMIGLCAQPLPLRMKLTSEGMFVDFLKCVGQEFCSAHRHLDFAKVTRDAPNLFMRTSFHWAPGELEMHALPEWRGRSDCPTIEPFPVEVSLWSRVPWDAQCLFGADSRKHIWGHMLYRADLFESHTIDSLFAELRTVSERVVREPRVRVSSLQSSSCSRRVASA